MCCGVCVCVCVDGESEEREAALNSSVRKNIITLLQVNLPNLGYGSKTFR